MPKTRKQKRGGKFALSDDKIREFMGLGLSSGSYETDPAYWKNIPRFLCNNSTITKMSIEGVDQSSYGVIYKLTLKDGVPSPLVNLSLSTSGCTLNAFYRNKCFKEVRTFLLKLSFLDEAGDTDIGLKKTQSITEFKNETNIQNLCYDITYNLGESVVPGCISPSYIEDIEDESGINPLLQMLLDSGVDADGYLNYIMKSVKYKNIKRFGIITMEFAEGFRTLKSIIEDPSLGETTKVYAINLAKASHLLLYANGVIQGDPHNENVMVKLDYKGFLDSGDSGKALIIDFGRAFITHNDIPVRVEKYQAIFEEIIDLTMENAEITYAPSYHWLNLKASADSDIFDIMDSLDRRNGKLLTAIKAALPKNDTFFAGFLEKLNSHASTFNDFNVLRWTNIAKPFTY